MPSSVLQHTTWPLLMCMQVIRPTILRQGTNCALSQPEPRSERDKRLLHLTSSAMCSMKCRASIAQHNRKES